MKYVNVLAFYVKGVIQIIRGIGLYISSEKFQVEIEQIGSLPKNKKNITGYKYSLNSHTCFKLSNKKLIIYSLPARRNA